MFVIVLRLMAALAGSVGCVASQSRSPPPIVGTTLWRRRRNRPAQVPGTWPSLQQRLSATVR